MGPPGPVQTGAENLDPPPGFDPRTVQPTPELQAFFFFFCWRYNPLWVLAFSVIFFHSVLSLLSFLIPIVWISSSTSSFHLFLGLPLIPLPLASTLVFF